MKDAAFDKFVSEKLDWMRSRYERGEAPSFAEAFLLCLKDKNGESFTEEKPLTLACAIQGGDDQIRFGTQQAAKERDAFAVMVRMEAWFAEVAESADEALKERVRRAADTQTIDKLEPGLRREKVILHFESIEEPIRIFSAEIARENSREVTNEKGEVVCDGGKATLGPWERAETRLPRPTFRRYLAEYRDGKKTFGLSVPGAGTIRLVYGDGK